MRAMPAFTEVVGTIARPQRETILPSVLNRSASQSAPQPSECTEVRSGAPGVIPLQATHR